jgi:hypothetical protein
MSTSSTPTANTKKNSRAAIDQTDLTINSSGSKKASTSDASSNRKCLIM